MNLEKRDLLNYYWKYFELQSHQRNQTCVLYASLFTALIASFLVAVGRGMIWAQYLILILISAVSIIFIILFKRSTELRDKARTYLSEWEVMYMNDKDKRLFDENEKNGTVLFTYTNILALYALLFSVVPLIVIFLMGFGVIGFNSP